MAASAALKQSVEKASAQVASLQAAVVSIWHTIGPYAVASLNSSPRELESFLRQVTRLTPVRNSSLFCFLKHNFKSTILCSLAAFSHVVNAIGIVCHHRDCVQSEYKFRLRTELTCKKRFLGCTSGTHNLLFGSLIKKSVT